MFNEKSKSLNLLHRQKNKFFLYHWRLNKFISHQTRITTYFLSSLNSFKFNILSKSKFCLFIQINVFFRRISLYEYNINFASRRLFFNNFYYFSHICRYCRQTFEFENQFHRYFRYCKKSFKYQIVAWNVVNVWKKL